MLPDDDQMLARATRMTVRKWKSIRPMIMEFFEEESGYIFNKRLRSEHTKASQKRTKKVQAGALGGKAKSLKDNNSDPSNDAILPPQKTKQKPSKSEPEPESYKKEPPVIPLKGEDPDLFEKPKPKRATQIPAGFPDAAAMEAAMKYWRDHGRPDLNARTEAAAFRDNKLQNAKTHKDWKAAWRTWLRNAIKYNPPPRNGFKDQNVSHGTIDASPEDWTRRANMFREKGMWSSDWGPKPDEAGCAAPPEILQKFNEQRQRA